MNSNSDGKLSFTEKVSRKIFGAPRDIQDPRIFHKLALIPLLAWIGLGADGLSSSSYGPEEAFKALGSHVYLAIFLAIATALTVSVISYAYANIIEHFPHGGGGYIVATHMLGEKAGVVSGCALIVDYVLTISVSIVSCVDALFSFMPSEYHKYKILTAAGLIVLLMLLNIRGLKESILVLAPIFIIFLITHILLLGYGIFSHAGQVKQVADNFQSNLSSDLSTMGFFGVLFIFLRAYSMGGGTYTGIEAVSNGLQALREPKVQFGKRTMLYMAASLALTAGGLFLCYLLVEAKPLSGKTLNAVLAESLYQNWQFGYWIALVTILSEGALLLVGAQTGFIDAPRVMANMAVDSWLPHRFASFSERLTMRNGILMIGVLALAVLFYTHGSISTLVVMYSINVFITFSLSEFGMARFYIKNRKIVPKWKRQLCIQLTGLIFCLTILTITICEKFREGGWLTLLITSLLILLCYIINSHYSKVKTQLKKLDEVLMKMPKSDSINTSPVNKNDMTAILLVGGFNGVGVHSLFSIIRSFPGMYKNFVFVSVAVIDQGVFKGEEGLVELKKAVEDSLKKYVELARRLGFPAEYRIATGTELVEQASELTLEISKEFHKSTVFSGQLSFRLEKFYHRLLHNEAAFAIQRRLQWNGVTNVILPIRLDTARPLVRDKKGFK
jgi:amino acid transporter/predicted HicB family RNase H-like nuclease